MVEYFIYYTYANGHGNCSYTCEREIKSLKDIQDIEKDINKDVINKDSSMNGKAVISNFIKL